VCISVFDLAEDWDMKIRNDLADQVGSAVRVKVREAHSDSTIRAEPRCVKVDQPGFDNQLRLILSIKRQKIKVDGHDWNLVIAGGISIGGLFEDRALQPVVIVQQESVSDDSVVDALVEFVDHTVVAALRRNYPSYMDSGKVPELR
jgi:hypothetical protein